MGTLTDTVIFEIPFFLSFTGWAVVGYVITGQPFGQFTSVYGTASQLKVSGANGPPQLLHARILHDVHDILYLAPTLLLVVILAAWMSFRRRRLGILAPISIVGGGMAFDAMAYLANSIAPWFRYFITAVPLEVLLVGCIVATNPALVSRIHSDVAARSRARRVASSVGAVAIVLVLLIPSSFTTIMGMKNPTVGFEETQHLGFIFVSHPSAITSRARPPGRPWQTWPTISPTGTFKTTRWWSTTSAAAFLQVILIDANPKVFVIPNDRDFQRTLDDPLTFHAHYILDMDPSRMVRSPRSTSSTRGSENGIWFHQGGALVACCRRVPGLQAVQGDRPPEPDCGLNGPTQ